MARRRLRTAAAPEGTPSGEDPGLGSTGPEAAGLVDLLRSLGKTVPDGDTVGPEVVAALVEVQADLGVEGESGVLGPKTRQAIRDHLDQQDPDDPEDEDPDDDGDDPPDEEDDQDDDTKSSSATLERKALLAPGDVDIVDNDQGIATMLVSVTGIVDEVDDVIEPGAYAKTLKRRLPKGVDAHRWEVPVAKALEAVELMPGDSRLPKQQPNGDPWPPEAGGLLVTAQYNLKTTAGRDTWENIKFFGTDQEFSIGYTVPKGGATRKGTTRHIKDIDLMEFSNVLFGAAPLSRLASLKAHPVTRPTAAGPAVERPWVEGSRMVGSAEWVRDRVNGPVIGYPDYHASVEVTYWDHVISRLWLRTEPGEVSPTQDGDLYVRVDYTVTGDVLVVTQVTEVTVDTVITPKAPTPDHLSEYDTPPDPVMVDVAADMAAMRALRAGL